jgi:hypothetical protein
MVRATRSSPPATGRPTPPNNVLHVVLGPVRERANEILEADGHPPIAHLTPHTLDDHEEIDVALSGDVVAHHERPVEDHRADELAEHPRADRRDALGEAKGALDVRGPVHHPRRSASIASSPVGG